ncbi:16S rRNA (guanine(527)-N(7))-methyltransferase RsmG [uncultured Megasphaera sp.]|uniref:16S rRNA (guanine(527)-N(7))-methyltransferase RsmG n=1 Tax=uncultured Megasphaera sp. TaxID=165188 RepID=UPI00265B2AB5|nr:16S rRNA (guanine(527)-N(7))-methyltransferase RsmG [uncultured Megasphaera sp.]
MFNETMKKAASAYGLDLTNRQLQQFCLFRDELVETNKVMNLTAITDDEGVAVKHMIDSLSCYDAACFPEGASVLDLGTGAGFPGLPLLIYRPDLQVTFFDSLNKRLTFLQGLTEKMGLPASFLHGRAEDMAHQKEYREAFDVVTSRAVARLPILAEWALPYVRQGGYFISLKGAQYEEEVAASKGALQILGAVVAEIRPVHLPGMDDTRAVIYMKKIKGSPKKYPRKPKAAARQPL